jgi:hypothetical protein
MQVDLLPEISVPPHLPPIDKMLPEGLKRQVDSYLRTRQPRSLLQVCVIRRYLSRCFKLWGSYHCR